MEHPLRSILDHVAPGSTLYNILRQVQAGYIPDNSSPLQNITNCLLADIGNFVVFVNDVLLQMVAALVDGKHIEVYSYQRFDDMVETSDFSDLSSLDYLQGKVKSLQALQQELRSAQATMQKLWNASPPLYFDSEPTATLNYFDETGAMTRQSQAFSGSPQFLTSHRPSDGNTSAMIPWSFTGSPSDSSTPSYNQSMAISPGQISRTGPLAWRGTGQWMCPFGENCDKGGLDADGRPRVFVANSAFNIHMQKHEKPFKCTLPKCPNSEGFATKFQLQRHQKTVKHATDS